MCRRGEGGFVVPPSILSLSKEGVGRGEANFFARKKQVNNGKPQPALVGYGKHPQLLYTCINHAPLTTSNYEPVTIN